MTTLKLKFNLPDQLAREAQEAGLLSPEAIQSMVVQTLRARRVDELFTAMDRMAAIDSAPMTEVEIQAEIDAARAERCARRS